MYYVYVGKTDDDPIVLDKGNVLSKPVYHLGVLTKHGEMLVPVYANPSVPDGFRHSIRFLEVSKFIRNNLIISCRTIEHI